MKNKTEKNILIAFMLNLGFSIFEIVGGLFTGSVAIISDSVHDFGDALSIGISYFLERRSKKKRDLKHTNGYLRYSLLGSIITTIILIVGSIFVIYESINRFINPVEINYDGMIFLAVIGVVINFIASYVTKEGDSLNQKSVNLHMLEDVLGWVVVLIGSILMKWTDISIIDSILSIGVALFIFIHAFKNLIVVIDIFLEKTPKNINVEEIKKHLLNIDGVKDIHHMHIRSIDGYKLSATLHAVLKKYNKEIKEQIKDELKEFGIDHSTIELEELNEDCTDECELENVNTHHYHHHHH